MNYVLRFGFFNLYNYKICIKKTIRIDIALTLNGYRSGASNIVEFHKLNIMFICLSYNKHWNLEHVLELIRMSIFLWFLLVYLII